VIVQEIDSQSKKWHDLMLKLQTTYDEGTRRYREFELLIKYIEEAMMDPEATFAKQVKWISIKNGFMEKTYSEGTKMFKDKV
jgi:hypothetical protein